MLRKTKIKLIEIFKDMIEERDKKLFRRIVNVCVDEAFARHDIRKTVEIKDWDSFIDVKITTYKNEGNTTITQKEVFHFVDLTHLLISTDDFIERIREKFKIGE